MARRVTPPVLPLGTCSAGSHHPRLTPPTLTHTSHLLHCRNGMLPVGRHPDFPSERMRHQMVPAMLELPRQLLGTLRMPPSLAWPLLEPDKHGPWGTYTRMPVGVPQEVVLASSPHTSALNHHTTGLFNTEAGWRNSAL